jgi:hypothetical protein
LLFLPPPQQTLERDAQLLAELMAAARAAGMPAVARAVQRSVVLRIGLGGPAQPDGFNPDLELLARAALLAPLFDDDFRLVLGHFAYNNFQALLGYHEMRSRAGLFAVDRAAMVRALCDVLPGGEQRHIGEAKEGLTRFSSLVCRDQEGRAALAVAQGGCAADGRGVQAAHAAARDHAALRQTGQLVRKEI